MIDLGFRMAFRSVQYVTGAQLTILNFHRVLRNPDPIVPSLPDVSTFRRIIDYLSVNYTVVALDDAVIKLQRGTLPRRAVVITFDDGYADNAELALPVLQSAGVVATFFVAVGFLDGGIMWNDKVIEGFREFSGNALDLRELGLETYSCRTAVEKTQAIESVLTAIKHRPQPERDRIVDEVSKRCAGGDFPTNLMMSKEQVVCLSRSGMGIGAHTITHPILARIPDDQANEEIIGSKGFLENLLDKEVALFAYPNGAPDSDYDKRHVDMVQRAGFSAAVSTAIGAAHRGSDLFQLPRFTPWRVGRLGFNAQLIQNQLRTRSARVA